MIHSLNLLPYNNLKMADHTSLVCSPELATALSPYFLIEVDEDTLNTL